MQRVDRKVLCGFLGVVKGGVGVILWESCIRCWSLLKPSLGC
jgi:hypothetical protein